MTCFIVDNNNAVIRMTSDKASAQAEANKLGFSLVTVESGEVSADLWTVLVS